MAAGDHNPSAEWSWTDAAGVVWQRKGKRGRVLDPRRVRTLLQRADVPLIVWESFTTQRYDDPAAKERAAARLDADGSVPSDVHASEWSSDDGQRLLMLELSC